MEVTRVNTGNTIGFMYYNTITKMWHLKTLKKTFKGVIETSKLITNKINAFVSECGEIIQLTVFSEKHQVSNPKW